MSQAPVNTPHLLSIEHHGKFIHACPLPGEGRDGNVYPAHPNGIQLSKDRFLLLYATRSYRGSDDDRSIVYQIRQDGFAGRVIKEGFIARTRDDWDPLHDGRQYVLQHGQPMAFGVPKGAMIGGGRAPHENVFAAMWRIEARWIDPLTGFMTAVRDQPALAAQTRDAQWTQFRLNDAGDDIEILQPIQPLRQLGYETGSARCAHESQASFVKGLSLPIPLNDDCSQWIDLNSVPDGVVACRYAFNSRSKLYEWAQVGPIVGPLLSEASVARWRGRFVVAARASAKLPVAARTVVWWQMDDPFAPAPPPLQRPVDQPNWFPLTAYTCPDGVLRRFGGCIERSPYHSGRDPAYAVDVDPDRDFAVTGHQLIFDGKGSRLPMRIGPIVDMVKLLPHAGGRTQVIVHRVRGQCLCDPVRPELWPTQAELDASGIYRASAHYAEAFPGMWSFV